jgi:hypothetical protein
MLSTCSLLGVYYKSTYGFLPLHGRYGEKHTIQVGIHIDMVKNTQYKNIYCLHKHSLFVSNILAKLF